MRFLKIVFKEQDGEIILECSRVREPWLTPALAGGTQEAERGASGSRRAPWFGYLASCLSLGMGEVSGLGGTRAP